MKHLSLIFMALTLLLLPASGFARTTGDWLPRRREQIRTSRHHAAGR
ncbi:hypothetical protein [Gluconobacter albidus]|nr:hypothetical protein [Gluconobacter albidus]MBS1029644.1 hypothetical protein [Gluconobacter albidus]